MAKEEDDKNKLSKTSDKIQELEERISKTKYNKKTQHAIGLMKAQLARLKEKQEARSGSGGKGEGYSVRKSGDATVVLLGFPSVGKSTLLNSLTNAESETGAYAFTTLTVVPGMMEYKNAKIQILDVPGIVKGAASGTGRGKEVLQVLRNADLILIIVDVFHPEHHKIIEKEVYESHIRINQEKPDVTIKKTSRGGINIGKTVFLPNLDDQTIISILKEFKINNADVLIRSNINADQFIDVLEKNKVYVPSLTIINKIDMVDKSHLNKVKEKVASDIDISAGTGKNIEGLKEKIHDSLNLMSIFLKEIGKKADLEEPMIMTRGSTLKDLCEKLHKEFVSKFRFARIWGSSSKFDGQKIMKLNHVLKDGDIVEIRLS